MNIHCSTIWQVQYTCTKLQNLVVIGFELRVWLEDTKMGFILTKGFVLSITFVLYLISAVVLLY